MKKFSTSLVLGFSIITLMSGAASAHSTSMLTWGDTTAEQRVGDYNEFVAPVDGRSMIKLDTNQTSIQYLNETAEKRSGNYSQFVAAVDTNKVVPLDNNQSTQFWNETAIKRSGNYSQIVAPTD